MNELKKIITELYESNFNILKKSSVSSSHWDEYTKKLSVTKIKNEYNISSYGIANFTHKNIYSIIKSIPRKFFLFYLYTIYLNNIKILKNIIEVCNKTNTLIEFDHIKHGIILNKLSEKELYKSIDLLIKNKKYRQKLQILSNKNFHFTHKKSSSQIDLCRNLILRNNKCKELKFMIRLIFENIRFIY